MATNLQSTAGSFHNGHAERFGQRCVEEDVTLHQNSTNIFMLQSPQQTHSAVTQFKEEATCNTSLTHKLFPYTSLLNHNYFQTLFKHQIFPGNLSIQQYLSCSWYFSLTSSSTILFGPSPPIRKCRSGCLRQSSGIIPPRRSIP